MLAMKILILASLIGFSTAAGAGSPPGLVFEDRNNNGVFDEGDADVTAEIRATSVYETTESVVFTGKALKSINTDGSNGFSVRAGKRITIDASLNGNGAGATMSMVAPIITVGDDVRIVMKEAIFLQAGSALVLGRNVVLRSDGNVSLISATGNVLAGEKLNAESREEVMSILAPEGMILLGDQARLFGKLSDVELFAEAGVSANRASIDGGSVSFFTSNGGVALTNGNVKGQAFIRLNGNGSGVDTTGTKFSQTPDITP